MKLRRKIQPLLQPVELKDIPEAEVFYLENGVPVYIINAGTEELMRIEFFIDAGQVRERTPLVASTVNAMLLEGSANHSANEINSEFDYYGAYINPFIQKDSAGLTAFLLNKHAEKIVGLCQEILFKPSFPETELNNLQRKRLQTFLMNRKRVQNIASDKFFESVFGNEHPYGRQIKAADFEVVTKSMLTEFHSNYYIKGNMSIIISGKIHPEIKRIITHFFGMHDFGPKSSQKVHIPITGKKNKQGFVRKKDAIQSAIRIGSVTINKKHEDYNGLLVLDTIIGGYFGSRLMKNIREKKGYTYGIHSSLVSLQQSGYKVIATEVDNKYIRNTIAEIYKEIRILQTKPVEKGELEVVKNYMTGEMVRMFDGPFAIAESFRAAWEFGLGQNYYKNLIDKIRSIDSDEIIYLAKKYYDPDDLYEIIAGHQ